MHIQEKKKRKNKRIDPIKLYNIYNKVNKIFFLLIKRFPVVFLLEERDCNFQII